ncbi:MAG: RidA family protein [Oscillatoriales cyanobacterium SM2_1_8]|nr:RidA family protein [Oscillatoriales cyanobacterium SM2_1_8]
MRTPIRTAGAPLPVGPYNQAIAVGNLVFTAGQVAINPATGELTGDIAAQTGQVLQNLRAVLQAAGSDLSHVVKTTVFLANMDDFAAMNAVYAQHFPDPAPARSCVQAARLPLGALVEIEAIAIAP